MTDILPAPRGSRWPSILLARARATDPTDLDAADRRGAFVGLRAAVAELGPAGTIAEVASSGLRGRGGAGYLTGRQVAGRGGPRRPAPLRRGQRLRGGPGRGVRSASSWPATPTRSSRAWPSPPWRSARPRRSSPSAPRPPRRSRPSTSAVGQALDAGLIGPDSLGPGGDLAMRVETVQGAYMLGEETVLLKALEGKRGQPEQRPPHPTERGLFGAPTVVQNVQTLASVAWILANGGRKYAAIGPLDSPGTTLVHAPRRQALGRRRGAAGDAAERDRRAWAASSTAGASSRACSSAGRRGASCRRAGPHAVHLRRPPRGRRPRRLGQRHRRRRPRPAWSTWPACSPASAPTRRAARRSPAGSACAG